jgi:hypothetical protein
LPFSTSTPPPNENRKIRAKGSQIPIALVNLSRLSRITNPTKKNPFQLQKEGILSQ